MIVSIKSIRSVCVPKSVRCQSSPIDRPIVPIPTFVIGVAVEGILGDQAFAERVFDGGSLDGLAGLGSFGEIKVIAEEVGLPGQLRVFGALRSEEHTSELQSQ